MYPLVINYISEAANMHFWSSHKMRGSRILLLLMLTLGAGSLGSCATESLPVPLVQQICTAKSSNSCSSWVYAGEDVAVRIEGQNLLETWQVDLGKDSPAQPMGSFRAWIGPAELSDIEKLPIVSNSGRDILQGVLTGTLDVGYYPVKVETPSGMAASFPGPVFVRTPLFVSADMAKLHAPVQDTLRMSVTVENKSTSAIGDISITITQGGTGSVYLPQPPPSFSLEAQSSLQIALDLTAASPGQPEIQVRAKAVTSHGVELEEDAPEIITLDILQGASLQVEAEANPQQVQVGSNIALVARVKNTGGVAVNDATMVIDDTQGPGQLQWSPMNGSRTIEPGSESIFSMTATALSAGAVDISLIITGTEGISGRPLEFSPGSAVQVDITGQ